MRLRAVFLAWLFGTMTAGRRSPVAGRRSPVAGSLIMRPRSGHEVSGMAAVPPLSVMAAAAVLSA